MCNNIKISFIIPVFNGEHVIKRCIASIEQCFNSNSNDNDQNNCYEIVIINDGSTDSTLEILQSLKEENNAILIIDSLNSGVSCSRNKGLNMAKGQYVFFIDADDYLVPCNFEEDILNQMDEYKIDCLKIGYLRINYDQDQPTESIKQIDFNTDIITGINWLKITKSKYGGPWNYIHRRKNLIENSVKFHESVKIGEDLLFNIEALLHAKRVASIESFPFYLYVQYPTSACHIKRNWTQCFSIGYNNACANLELKERTRELNLPEIEYLLDRIRDYSVFGYCIWPLVRDNVGLKEIQRILMFLRDQNLIPIARPDKDYKNILYSWQLTLVWKLSRYKNVFIFLTYIRFIFLKILNKVVK